MLSATSGDDGDGDQQVAPARDSSSLPRATAG
jgi:hypothetical protein